MKKILTVSLVAVMAVSAAHADIASTKYVDNKVSPVATKVGSAQFANGAAAGKTDVTAAIDAVAGVVAGLSDGDGSVASQIAAAKQELQGYADTAAGNALTAAKDDAKQYIDATELQTSQEAQDAVLKKYTDDAIAVVNSTVGDATDLIATTKQELEAYAEDKADAALAAAKDDAKQYIDATELQTAQTAQDTTLKAYADEKANAALAAAKDDAKQYIDATELQTSQEAQDAVLKKYTDDAIAVVNSTVGDATDLIATTKQELEAYAEDKADAALAAAKDDAKQYIDATELQTSQEAQDAVLKKYTDDAKTAAITSADTAAKAMIQLTQAMTDCAQKQCALTINNGDILWEEVINQ